MDFIDIYNGQRVQVEERSSYEDAKWQCGPCQTPKPIKSKTAQSSYLKGFLAYSLDIL